MSCYLIVGDAYDTFSRHEGVLGISQALRLFAEVPPEMPGRVIIGQGIAESARAQLLALLPPEVVLDGLATQGDPAPLWLTHKTRRAHVLIAEAGAPGELSYDYHFILDDADDRLCDHVTGQHVSAMLLMEAGRQAVIASIERQYPAVAGKWGIVLDKLTASFASYAFPVPTHLRVIIQPWGEASSKHVQAALRVVFQQADVEVCRMQFDVQLYKQAALESIEKRKARALVDTLLASHPDNAALV